MSIFNTELLIKEVQKRPCLWESQDPFHSDRAVKNKAWEEVAVIVFQGWSTLSKEEQTEKLKMIKNKWKNARDYYVREKNRENQEAKGRAAKRKWNCPYFDSLQFLNIKLTQNKKNCCTRPHVDDFPNDPNHTENNTEYNEGDKDYFENNEAEEIEVKFDPSAWPTAPEMSLFEQSTTSNQTMSPEPSALPSNADNQADNPKNLSYHDSFLTRLSQSEDCPSDCDPNVHFLLSILPEMAKMTDRQNFAFRMEVMKALNKVKYKLPDPENNGES
ncbi:alcohol dehydrogenase transcription factor myb/SANT-like domain-containing protein [Phthorimaea operculella]|nr:alcohol dehydrogenase transcription factor myb/SANT-like domain-containing protein [Phthorimaea operculella]